MPQKPSRLPQHIAALLLIFTAVLIAGLRTNLRTHAETLEAHLAAQQP